MTVITPTFYNHVNDWLTVGGDLDLARDLTGMSYAETIQHLRSEGVTHVLDARIEWEDEAEWMLAGLPQGNYCHAPVIDKWGHMPDEAWFSDVEKFVEYFWFNSAHGDRLFIHCHMGINRGPSAAMLALLTVDPLLHPWQAFMQIRDARPVAGLVYAEAVGVRHLLDAEGTTVDQLLAGGMPESVRQFSQMVKDYWTPEMLQSRRQGISFYRSFEGGTLVVDSTEGF